MSAEAVAYDCLIDMCFLEQQVAPGGMITGTGAPFPPTGFSSYQAPEEEPEPVRYVS